MRRKPRVRVSDEHVLFAWGRSVCDGSMVKTYFGQAGIFEVCWNAQGTKVAACFSNNNVAVIDVQA